MVADLANPTWSAGVIVLRRWGAAVVGALVVAVASGAVFHLHAVQPTWGSFQGDLAAHLLLTEEVMAGERVVPHPGFHIMVGSLSRSLGLALSTAATILLIVSNVATYALTVWVLRRQANLDAWKAAGLGLLLSFAAAVYVPWFSANMYRGHGTPNIWHSPTWVFMQPFALGSVAALLEWRRERDLRWATVASAALLISAAVKPSWAVVVLPVLGVTWIGEIRRPTWWHLPVVAIPTVCLLGVQFLVLSDGQGGGVAVDPFSDWASKTPSLPVSVLLATAFPLIVLAWHRRAWTWWGVRMGVGVWIVGFLQRALLIEPARPGHGNWAWGYFIALKVLFVVAAVAAMRSPRHARVALGVLLVHVGAGVLYVYRLVTGAGYS